MLEGLMTEKQAAFLAKLASERDPENLDVMQAVAFVKHPGLTSKQNASLAISALMKMPKHKATTKSWQPAPAPVPAPVLDPASVLASIPDIEVTIGVYDTAPWAGELTDLVGGGRVVIAYMTKKGVIRFKKLYTSYETKSGWSWKGASSGASYLITKKIKTGKAVKLTAGQVGALGKKYGFCLYCTKTLTDPTSINLGYGKVCAGYYNLPYC